MGGDSSAVQDQLRNVQQVHATGVAFAAILADGSVVTWGDPDGGGDSSAVQDQLRNVQQVHAAWWSMCCYPWQMDLSLLGASQIVVAIALPCKISSGTCSRFMPQVEHLLLSWQMDLS